VTVRDASPPARAGVAARAAWRPPTRSRVARIRERLAEVYGVPLAEPHGDAPPEEIEEAIRPGGISKVKSARIQAILRAIGDDLDLEWMRDAPVPESQRYLCSLPGVGRKTAACVLLFAYGLRDVPVDTHVSRVGTRLGLLRPKAPFEELHDAMLALTPPGAELELHVNLLRHGRRTCHSQRPQCGACALARMCPSRREFWPPARQPKAGRTERRTHVPPGTAGSP